MIEFFGGKTLDSASCMFLSQCDTDADAGWDFKFPHELDYFLTQGIDVSRSLWDKRWLIAHLDLEYVNFDFPAEPYLDPTEAFFCNGLQNWLFRKFFWSKGFLHYMF